MNFAATVNLGNCLRQFVPTPLTPLSSVDVRVDPYELAPFLNRSSHMAMGRGRTRLREPRGFRFD